MLIRLEFGHVGWAVWSSLCSSWREFNAKMKQVFTSESFAYNQKIARRNNAEDQNVNSHHR
jgi:hypothetical protein